MPAANRVAHALCLDNPHRFTVASTAISEDHQLDQGSQPLILPGGRQQILQVFAAPGDPVYLLEVRIHHRVPAGCGQDAVWAGFGEGVYLQGQSRVLKREHTAAGSVQRA